MGRGTMIVSNTPWSQGPANSFIPPVDHGVVYIGVRIPSQSSHQPHAHEKIRSVIRGGAELKQSPGAGRTVGMLMGVATDTVGTPTGPKIAKGLIFCGKNGAPGSAASPRTEYRRHPHGPAWAMGGRARGKPVATRTGSAKQRRSAQKRVEARNCTFLVGTSVSVEARRSAQKRVKAH